VDDGESAAGQIEPATGAVAAASTNPGAAWIARDTHGACGAGSASSWSTGCTICASAICDHKVLKLYGASSHAENPHRVISADLYVCDDRPADVEVLVERRQR
jgi:hypothetical protein